MPYNSLTSRADAQALIPEEVATEIIKGAQKESAALGMFRRTTMSRKQQRMPALSALPMAYFVNGDTGFKQTTKVEWENIYLNAEPIATIVPIPEDVLDDTEFDLWAEIMPLVQEAVGRALDEAIFFSVNKPASWPEALVPAARAAGNTQDLGGSAADIGGVAQDFNLLMGAVEADGYNVTGHAIRNSLKPVLRGARDSNGQRLVDFSGREVEGVAFQEVMSGMWPAGVHAVSGDYSKGIIATRKDLTAKVLTEAPITDADGNIILNLAQQDSVALRVVARFAFVVANPVNYERPDTATRYPFATLEDPAAP